jgi:delta8-fatty-acid desaturase
MLGMALADWFGGLSAGWWCDNHDIHHLVTNHPEHDPDIQHIPFFAVTAQFFRNMWSTYYKRIMWLDAPSKFLITVQHRLYYIVLSLARFNLYALSYMYLAGSKVKHNFFWKFEIAGLCFYWCYFGSMLYSLGFKMGLAYLLVSHICASPVHVQIVLSHFACSTDDLGPGESFPSRQLRTTMDVVCGEDIEFIHGGLHLQVTHHLFPRLPRHNLRKASLLVKDFCKEQNLEYLEYGWIEGNFKVLATLKDVANQLHILKQVADKEIDERMH